MRPWRCELCSTRFHAWSVPVAFVHYAHCSACGNLDLQRIDASHVEHVPLKWLWPKIGAHAYRCGQCRRRFFSFRRYHRIVTLYEEALRRANRAGDTSS